MSILVKGMKIPKNCLECIFRISYWKRALTPSGKIFTYGCMLNGKEINTLEKRCKDYPIDGIPTPHERLIDAEKLAVKIWTEGHFVNGNDCEIAVDFIQSAPTIIEAEA